MAGTSYIYGWDKPPSHECHVVKNDKNMCVCLCVCVHMKYEAGLRAFLTVSMWSHKSLHTLTHKHFPPWQSIHPIMACLGYACHHSDKRQGHQGIVGYLSPPTYRQPAILDRWESGFVCSLSLSLPHSFWPSGCFPLCNGADPNLSYIRMAYQPTDILLNNLHCWHFKHVKKF